MRRLTVFLLFVILSSQTKDNTKPPPCTSSRPVEKGKPVWLQFTLSNNPMGTKSFVYIKKGEEFVLEGPYNLTKKDLDLILPQDGYVFGGINGTILTLFITSMGPQHEGQYKVEDRGLTTRCYLRLDSAIRRAGIGHCLPTNRTHRGGRREQGKIAVVGVYDKRHTDEPSRTVFKEHFDWIGAIVVLTVSDLVISFVTFVLLVLLLLRTPSWTTVPSQDQLSSVSSQ